MNVTSIDITGLHFDDARERHQACVSLEYRVTHDSAPVLSHFVCHADRSADSPASLVTQDLVEDALRQASRMPGYRRGERQIELTGAARDYLANKGAA